MMKTIKIALFVAALLGATSLFAQVGTKVENVTIKDLQGNPAKLPYFGEKNLLIFYVDPDHAKQNEDFTVDLETNGRASGDNIVGIGVINLGDAPFIPNKLARTMARKRTENNGAVVYSDESKTLSKMWGLGDCNNLFTLMVIDKNGTIAYFHKGIISEAEKENFYEIVKKYR